MKLTYLMLHIFTTFIVSTSVEARNIKIQKKWQYRIGLSGGPYQKSFLVWDLVFITLKM